MAEFLPAFELVQHHEFVVPKSGVPDGSMTNDPDDPGGPTKYGMSLRFMMAHLIDVDGDKDVDIHDVIALSWEQAKAEWKEWFWDLYGYDKISSQKLATKVFDLCLNMGPKKPHVFLQRALCKIGKIVFVDGRIGPETLSAVNSLTESQINSVVAHICEFAKEYYSQIVAKRPRSKKYLNGWHKRAEFLGPQDKETKWGSSPKKLEASSEEAKKPKSP